MDIVTVFCEIDDFCKVFEVVWRKLLLAGGRVRNRRTQLSLSEVMTILVTYHESGYKNLKSFYLREIGLKYRNGFPHLLSYNRFVELQRRCVMPLYFYLVYKRGDYTGISFIDATALKVCHNLRIASHKVFKDCAARDKSSTGWYYGFKPHLAVNEKGEILGFYVTAANIDEREPADWMTQDCWGKLIGDKGYISQTLLKS